MGIPDLDKFIQAGSPEAALVDQIHWDRLPRHVAVIMDGNGRWAEEKRKPRVFGHEAGVESVRSVVEGASRLGIGYLTLYAFSIENWKRPRSEVKTLFHLLRRFLDKELPTLMENDIRFQPIGRLDDLDEKTLKALEHAKNETRNNRRMVFNIALSYSGRAELVDAFRKMAEKLTNGGLGSEISESLIHDHLYTAGQPDPDLLIRTSGENRVSNFMLWQIAYTEIYISSVLWPEFRMKHLLEAVLDFQTRDRRYGRVRK